VEVFYPASTREFLSAVVMKNFIFWDIKPCGPAKVNLHLGETSHLLLQVVRVGQEKHSMQKAASRDLFGSSFDTELRKGRLIIIVLYGVIRIC
jgi:hypothetical protein